MILQLVWVWINGIVCRRQTRLAELAKGGERQRLGRVAEFGASLAEATGEMLLLLYPRADLK